MRQFECRAAMYLKFKFLISRGIFKAVVYHD